MGAGTIRWELERACRDWLDPPAPTAQLDRVTEQPTHRRARQRHRGGPIELLRHDEDRVVTPGEQVARNAADAQVQMGRAANDDEIRRVVLRQ